MGTNKLGITWLNRRAAHRLMHRIFVRAVTVGISAITLSVFAAPHDLSGDAKSDLIFRNASTKQISGWLMNGLQVMSSVGLLGADPDWRVSQVGDFNGDGKANILWRHTNDKDQ